MTKITTKAHKATGYSFKDMKPTTSAADALLGSLAHGLHVVKEFFANLFSSSKPSHVATSTESNWDQADEQLRKEANASCIKDTKIDEAARNSTFSTLSDISTLSSNSSTSYATVVPELPSRNFKPGPLSNEDDSDSLFELSPPATPTVTVLKSYASSANLWAISEEADATKTLTHGNSTSSISSKISLNLRGETPEPKALMPQPTDNGWDQWKLWVRARDEDDTLDRLTPQQMQVVKELDLLRTPHADTKMTYKAEAQCTILTYETTVAASHATTEMTTALGEIISFTVL